MTSLSNKIMVVGTLTVAVLLVLSAIAGTPSLVIIDQQGRRVQQHFGQIPDMVIGAQIAELLAQDSRLPLAGEEIDPQTNCQPEGCLVSRE